MFSGLFKGIGAYSKALGLISELRLWKYILLPGIIGLGLAMMIAASAWAFYGPLGAFLLSFAPSFGGSFIVGLSNVISALLILTFGIILYKHLLMVLVSPFMSPLSEKIERHLDLPNRAYRKFSANQAIQDLLRGLRIALRNIVREIFYSIPLLLLSLIPGIGIIGALGLFLLQAYYAGFGNIDYTLERHFTVKESVRFIRRNRGLAIGNGSIFVLLLSTGIGAFIAPPLATIAATLETVKKLNLETPIPQRRSEKIEYV